jgi:hypothetical protein
VEFEFRHMMVLVKNVFVGKTHRGKNYVQQGIFKNEKILLYELSVGKLIKKSCAPNFQQLKNL